MIVVDASVAVQWIVEEDTSALSEALLVRPDLIAPDLLQIEVGNALRRKIFVGDVSMEQARAGLQFIREKVLVVNLTPTLLDRALELAHAMYHPIYDCVYLAVAEAERGVLATFDQELMERAIEQGLGHLVSSLPLANS